MNKQTHKVSPLSPVSGPRLSPKTSFEVVAFLRIAPNTCEAGFSSTTASLVSKVDESGTGVSGIYTTVSVSLLSGTTIESGVIGVGCGAGGTGVGVGSGPGSDGSGPGGVRSSGGVTTGGSSRGDSSSFGGSSCGGLSSFGGSS